MGVVFVYLVVVGDEVCFYDFFLGLMEGFWGCVLGLFGEGGGDLGG